MPLVQLVWWQAIGLSLYSTLKNPDSRMANKDINFFMHLIFAMFFSALLALHFVNTGLIEEAKN